MISDPDNLPNCNWSQCSRKATFQIYEENGLKFTWVCSSHRGAVQVNLERFGSLFAPRDAKGELGVALNPNAPPMQRVTPSQRPSQTDKAKPVKKDWQVEAVKKAEASAVPDQGKKKNADAVVDLPTVKKR